MMLDIDKLKLARAKSQKTLEKKAFAGSKKSN